MTPESLARDVITLCTGCDLCRELLEDAPCRFFPQLYALYDREATGTDTASSEDLRHLVDLCNACGQCPCHNARAMVSRAKDAFVARDGLSWSSRVLEDVRLIARVCGAFPRLTNILTQGATSGRILKRLAGIHPQRQLPTFQREGFDAWAKRRRLDRMREAAGRKVAYFTGCTARHLFPQVAIATVEVLERNGISVFVPDQRCCGMPTMLEGDRPFTFELVSANLPILKRCLDAGYDIVTSCPTCGYMLKSILREGAEFSDQYRSLVTELAREKQGDVAAVQARLDIDDRASTGRTNSRAARARQPWLLRQMTSGPVSGKAQDEGYFASLDGLDRLQVANHTYDLAEYLRDLDQVGELNLDLAAVPGRLAYYPPCHQKELDIGQPWVDLLRKVPGVRLDKVGDVFDCCGLGGIMGFKKEFHDVSLAMGESLATKIQAAAPDLLITDCLSCRLQFSQMLPTPVAHPVEILQQSYATLPA